MPAVRIITRWALAVAVAATIVALVVSPHRGRAVPSADYRPPLPPDALTNGCYPLPDGARLGFAYQVRTDGDVDGRRALVVQYDLIDGAAAAQGVVDAFTAVGFTVTAQSGTDVTLAKDGTTVGAVVTPLRLASDDQIVRGSIRFDLPVVARQSDDPVCDDVESTKRFS